MSGPWVRIDDRLIHAQVLLGWVPCLKPRQIVLADDRVAADAGVASMYRALGEDEHDIEVLDLAAAADRFREPADAAGILLVLRGVREARALIERGATLERVNLGGLHEVPGARRLLESVFLSRQDVADLNALLARGVRVEAQSVPTATAVTIDGKTLAKLWP